MPIKVEFMSEIRHFYLKDKRSKNTAGADQVELEELLKFCLVISRGVSPHYILTAQSVYELFNLFYKACLKKEKSSKNLLDFIIRKCFSNNFVKVEATLRKHNISSFEIFRLLEEKSSSLDSVFLEIIELLEKNNWLTQVDLSSICTYPHNAEYVRDGFTFLRQKKLDNLRNVKLFCAHADYAKELLDAWKYLDDNGFFHQRHSYLNNEISEIFQAMFNFPEDALQLAEGLVYLYKNCIIPARDSVFIPNYNVQYIFEYHQFLCKYTCHSLSLAKALTTLIKKPDTLKRDIDMIIEYPMHAEEIASALNVFTTTKINPDNVKLLHANPQEAKTIANLLVFLEERRFLTDNIYSGIADNARYVLPLYDIMLVLARDSKVLAVEVISTILRNADYIPEIKDKILSMSKDELVALNQDRFNSIIREVIDDTKLSDRENEKKRRIEARLARSANVCALEDIKGFNAATQYLNGYIFCKQGKVNKSESIEHVKKVFMQLLQEGLNTKDVQLLDAMCNVFNFINRGEHKVIVNIHKNNRYDTLFSKANTNTWTEMMKALRDQTHQLLMALVDNELDIHKKIALLSGMRTKAIFTEHRTNSFFNRFHDTATVNEINKKIATLNAQASPSLSR